MMKNLSLVLLFCFSSSAFAGFVAGQITLEQYSEIRQKGSSNSFWAQQEKMLENRAAGVYFSLKERSSQQKTKVYCIYESSIDVKALLVELDDKIESSPNIYYPKNTYTRALHSLIISKHLCK